MVAECVRLIPPAKHLEHIIELGLVIATSTRRVDLLHSLGRDEGDLVGSQPHDWSVTAVQLMYISSPVCAQLIPSEYCWREYRNGWPWDPAYRGPDPDNEM
jgi:hypothetical protein